MRTVTKLRRPKTPLLAVDCVVVDKKRNVLLIRRKNSPFKGSYALPGGFVRIGEDVEKACLRELKEETRINAKDLRLVGIYSDPHRDPRGHVCSVSFLCLKYKNSPRAGSDAVDVLWTDRWDKLNLGFDHKKIISDAMALL
ncbi:MAG: NUDIX domain-containing protein [Hyphomicrobium sp.]